MSITVALILIAVALTVGLGIGFGLFRYVLTSMFNNKMEEAQKEADVLKEKKLLEVKEKFLNKKAELEKEVQQRNSRIAQQENKLKQREMSISQRHEEIGRRKQELDNQQHLISKKENELAEREAEVSAAHEREIKKLEELSGLTAEEARNRLIENMKAEAQTKAQGYINEIIDEAKLTANKEAKRIVIQSIQRVATETAIENSVTVFHIENDEVKGRIIGREGRNIRALEAATGVEIVVDDTPEAIVISAFDPVRREICRLALHNLISDGRIHPERIL